MSAPRPPHPRRAPRLVAWAPPLLIAAGLFWASATPYLRFEQDELADLVVRKTGHAAAYGLLALAVWHALAATSRLRPARAWAWVATVLYAASDEFHQSFTPGRGPSARDVAIDASGAAVAIALGRAVLAWRARRRDPGRRRERAQADVG